MRNEFSCIIFQRDGQRNEISLRPLEFTFCIMEFRRFRKDVLVSNTSVVHMTIPY